MISTAQSTNPVNHVLSAYDNNCVEAKLLVCLPQSATSH